MKTLTISCESIDTIDVDSYKNVRVVISKPTTDFIKDLEPQDVIEHQDATQLLDAINLAYDEGFIMKWLMGKGSM